MKSVSKTAAACLLTMSCSHLYAHGGEDQSPSTRADAHGPIGVMAEHMHRTGEWMLSYRFMSMQMEDNYKGTDKLSPNTIATTEPNPYAGMPGMPPTLRVVPEDMRMDMHMLGAMYAPNDDLTLMLMLPYVEKTMDHITYQGGMGSTQLGRFTTESAGVGDIKFSGLIKLCACEGQRSHATLGLSLPTGSIDEKDEILTPMGMRPSPTLPYPMQLGSGTYDLLTGLTQTRTLGAWGMGAQYTGTWRLGRNDQDYSLGDVHAATAWGSYQFQPAVSASLRLKAQYQGKIDGRDARVMAPVQTADPDRQGGKRLDAGVGLNLAGQGHWLGHRLALEVLLPLYQDLNGPQLGTASQLVLGYQYAP